MAQILPNTPIGPVPSATLKLYNLLRRLPSGYVVWQRLDQSGREGPDFWVLGQERRPLLLKASTATPRDLKRALQPALFGDGAASQVPGAAEHAGLLRFRQTLAAELDGHGSATAVPAALIFPEVRLVDVEAVWPHPLPEDCAWAGKETFTPTALAAWIDERLGPPLNGPLLAALRRAFTPEVTIPAAFTVRAPPERNTDAGLTGYLLDYRQERLIKLDLDMPLQNRGAAGDFGIRLVNGVAGSGKSLILVYRAHMLRKLFPQKRVLVLTHNRALIRDLEARYLRLSGGDRSVEWYTFMGWCRRYWPRSIPWPEMVRRYQREELIRRAWHAHLTDTAVSARMLEEEIDWFKDGPQFGREAYLAADRTGRGFGLAESMRERVYAAMETYHRELYRARLADWGDIPRSIWHALEYGDLTLPEYDAVLVDEAQFFAPIWFEIIKRMVKPRTGYLFLVADPTQGFLRRGQSWLASGLDVRGRSHTLERSYRNTLQILNFATLLYRKRLPEDDPEIVAPDLMDMPTGTVPMIIPLTTPQDETTRVVNEIRKLLEAGVPRGHILVIHANWREMRHLLERLQRAFGPEVAADPREAEGGDYIRVCLLDAVTGLESPIVFLMGVYDLYEEEQSVRLSDEERLELIRDNTRRLYMAITRAGQRLVLTYVGDMPDTISALIAGESVGLEVS